MSGDGPLVKEKIKYAGPVYHRRIKSDYGTFTILRYKDARSWRVKVDIFPS